MEYGLVAIWLGTYLLVGLIALPLLASLCRGLPDRGAGLAIPAGLTVLGVVSLWIGRVAFGGPTLVIGLGVLAGLSVVARRYDATSPNWWIAAETGVVFALAFFLMIAIRAHDPAVHPLFGEKFLDFGLLQSLLRSSTLPPEDMWFAGEPVAYYYGGHLIAAMLAMLTDTSADFAYNLAHSGFYGTLVAGAYGVGGAIAAARDADRRTGGVWAAFLVGFASNFHTAGQLLFGALPTPLAEELALFLAPNRADELLAGAETIGYWSASRVIDGTINEFPLFAWLNGDMHAHMTSTGFTLLIAGLLFSYYLTDAEHVRRRRWLVIGAVPPVGGFVAVVNTWSYPTVLGLAAVTLAFAPADPTTLFPAEIYDKVDQWREASRSRQEFVRLVAAGGMACLVESLAFMWALPFFVGPASTRELAVFPDRSTLGALLIVHGAFILISSLYLIDRSPLGNTEQWLQVGLVVVGLLALSVLFEAAAVGLFVPLLIAGWVLARRRDADVGFETVLLVGALGLALIVEFVYVKEQAGPERLNTVFKTYAQVWLLWATAAGGMVAVLLSNHSLQVSIGTDSDSGFLEAKPGTPAAVGLRVVMALLVLSTSIYGVAVLENHFTGESLSRYQTTDDPTLNATQFMEEASPSEAAAIRWLDQRHGQPTIVTAAPGGYRWRPAAGKGASAPSSLTGIPTVLGWFHEIGYRGRVPYERRLAHVQTIYTGDDRQRQARLLALYDVDYVYFGPAERAKYGRLAGGVTVDDVPGVSVEREWDSVTIFRVNQSALPTTAGS